MTDEAKALVGRLQEAIVLHSGSSFRNGCVDCGLSANTCSEAADLIETQAREIERLRVAISAALRCTPQARHGAIIYDCGDPWEILTAALTGDSHD